MLLVISKHKDKNLNSFNKYLDKYSLNKFNCLVFGITESSFFKKIVSSSDNRRIDSNLCRVEGEEKSSRLPILFKLCSDFWIDLSVIPQNQLSIQNSWRSDDWSIGAPVFFINITVTCWIKLTFDSIFIGFILCDHRERFAKLLVMARHSLKNWLCGFHIQEDWVFKLTLITLFELNLNLLKRRVKFRI